MYATHAEVNTLNATMKFILELLFSKNDASTFRKILS